MPERYLKLFAKDNRKNSTKAEGLFWNLIIKNRQTGYRFLRQKIILGYIIDFYCPKLKLAIEIDGESHIEKYEQDNHKDKILISLGIFTIRYSNEQVLKNMEGVKIDLLDTLAERAKILKIKI